MEVMSDGTYERQERGMKPIVHAIEVKAGKVARAWVYQVEGDYREPGFASNIGKPATAENFPGYRKS